MGQADSISSSATDKLEILGSHFHTLGCFLLCQEEKRDTPQPQGHCGVC